MMPSPRVASIRTSRLFDRKSAATFGLYLALSVGFIGRAVIPDLSHSYIGRASDPALLMWSIAWWRHAISHTLSPFLTQSIFAPAGMNLAWTPTIPLAAIVLWPVTAAWGPIVSFNLLALLAPASAAWSACMLCRYLTNSQWPSILAGYVFGYSPYFLAQMLGGHLHLVLIFPVVIALYLAARWFNGDADSRTTVILIGLALAAQFLLSIEIYATSTMFAGFAIVLSLVMTTGAAKRQLVNMISVLIGAYALSLLIVSPYLYYLFAFSQPPGEIWNPRLFSIDLLNFIIPTEVNLLGALHVARNWANTFTSNPFECDAYLGPALIVLAILYARRFWVQPFARMVIYLLVIICALSLGPILQVAGHRLFATPAQLLSATPLINKALPGRFMMYTFLLFAIITAQWLAASCSSTVMKCAVAAMVVLCALPKLDATYWTTRSDIPEFFSRGIYKKFISPSENILVAPYSLYGNTMLWQAESGFYFRIAGGWTGVAPVEYQRWPLFAALTEWTYLPNPKMQLMSFLARHQVGAIVSADNDPARLFWPLWLPPGSAIPLKIGGVTLYRIAPDMLAPYRSITAVEAERAAAGALFDGLLAAIAKYHRDGDNPALLTPFALQNLGLLPADWIAATTFDYHLDTTRELYRGVWLGYIGKSFFGIGLMGTYAGLQQIVDRYGPYSYRIYFPYPQELNHEAYFSGRGRFIIIFDADGLKRAIEANSNSAPAL